MRIHYTAHPGSLRGLQVGPRVPRAGRGAQQPRARPSCVILGHRRHLSEPVSLAKITVVREDSTDSRTESALSVVQPGRGRTGDAGGRPSAFPGERGLGAFLEGYLRPLGVEVEAGERESVGGKGRGEILGWERAAAARGGARRSRVSGRGDSGAARAGRCQPPLFPQAGAGSALGGSALGLGGPSRWRPGKARVPVPGSPAPRAPSPPLTGRVLQGQRAALVPAAAAEALRAALRRGPDPRRDR